MQCLCGSFRGSTHSRVRHPVVELKVMAEDDVWVDVQWVAVRSGLGDGRGGLSVICAG
jgi:hypothetical protein